LIFIQSVFIAHSNKFYLSNDIVIWPKNLQQHLFKTCVTDLLCFSFGFPPWGINKAVIAEGRYYYNGFRESGLSEMSQAGTPKVVAFTIIVTDEKHWL